MYVFCKVKWNGEMCNFIWLQAEKKLFQLESKNMYLRSHSLNISWLILENIYEVYFTFHKICHLQFIVQTSVT